MKSLLQTIQHNVKAAIVGTVVLFACLLLGHGQASAQTFQDPATAMNTIKNTLTSLSSTAPVVTPGLTVSGSASNVDAVASATSNGLTLKLAYLDEVGKLIKSGQTTGTAIDAVYGTLQQNLGTRSAALLDDTKAFVVNLLIQ
jgi:hypothetical protein